MVSSRCLNDGRRRIVGVAIVDAAVTPREPRHCALARCAQMRDTFGVIARGDEAKPVIVGTAGATKRGVHTKKGEQVRSKFKAVQSFDIVAEVAHGLLRRVWL